MAVWANLVDCDETYCPLGGLLVGRFGRWFFALNADGEKVLLVVTVALDLLFLVFAVARGRDNKGIGVSGLCR